MVKGCQDIKEGFRRTKAETIRKKFTERALLSKSIGAKRSFASSGWWRRARTPADRHHLQLFDEHC